MGGRRLPYMMPVTSRSVAYSHFINSIFEGTKTESTPASDLLAHSVSTAVGLEADQA